MWLPLTPPHCRWLAHRLLFATAICRLACTIRYYTGVFFTLFYLLQVAITFDALENVSIAG